MSDQNIQQAKEYQRIRQKLSLFSLGLKPVLLLLPVILPLSVQFKAWAVGIHTNSYATASFYFLFLSLFLLIFDGPLSFYSGYTLEHRFKLSNQTLGQWFKDFFKKSVLSFLLSLALLLGLYALIWKFPDKWWLWAWAGFAGVSYVMGKIFPVFIVPLFYKYGPVENESLKERILAFVAKYGLPASQLFSINLSKTTKKANAAFMGMGKTKRVVLSDTLIDQFTEDEIETVVAHELGHFKHKDIWRQLILGLVTSFLAFWIAFQWMPSLSKTFGLKGVSDVAALPLLFFVFYVFGIALAPIQNGFSRWLERQADRFALVSTKNKESFVSCMQKLASVNLADPDPHPLYEWFFYDHPAIAKRIAMADEVKL